MTYAIGTIIYGSYIDYNKGQKVDELDHPADADTNEWLEDQGFEPGYQGTFAWIGHEFLRFDECGEFPYSKFEGIREKLTPEIKAEIDAKIKSADPQLKTLMSKPDLCIVWHTS